MISSTSFLEKYEGVLLFQVSYNLYTVVSYIKRVVVII